MSTPQDRQLGEDSTGAAHDTHHHAPAWCCLHLWSAGQETTAEILAKKNKSGSLNKLQWALCSSKETRRGLQLKKVESMVLSRETSLAKFHLPV